MKCNICEQNEASVYFKQTHHDVVKEMSVCEEFAAQKGFDVHSPMPLTNLLFGVGVQQENEPDEEDKSCPACQMRRSEFRKSSRLGCPACYQTFSDDLMPLLTAMHKGSRHVGKIPAGEGKAARLAVIQMELEKAVASQNFEEAARLRDQIRGFGDS